ncbi:STAS domain-containing protein [Hymenobacter sp. ASUV-10]|uniref:Anti-sigma factor antagonist n=2 Tax=Hymenobacter aranciens TaxID=3063996 RepID=A0ABT9BBP8_9BACT|nr:STAS domain-containing protein [Hymenobacter sp. ASUV-10]MDO7875691.1 STAS domain-containing protein [Hymenobacter sp. ASUV-10]
MAVRRQFFGLLAASAKPNCSDFSVFSLPSPLYYPEFPAPPRCMKYTIDKKESYTIITIDEKKLDTTVAPDLKSEFVKLNAEGINNLILDLSNVKYTDSSGLSSILIANRLCNSTGGLLVLSGLQDHVMKLITISKLESVLHILPTVEEAIDRVFLHAIERDLTDKE